MSDGTAIVQAGTTTLERPNQSRLLMPRFNPIEMMEAHDSMRQWVFAALKANKDYGILPGTRKNILLKPGTDRIIKGFQLTATCVITEQEIDHDRLNTFDAGKWVTITDPGKAEADRLKNLYPEKYRSRSFNGKWHFQEKTEEKGTSLGLYRYVVECRLYDPDGVYIGNATGICSTMESKYIRSPRDAEHTAYSMAAKRAKTAAVIAALGLSDIFEAEDADAEEAKAPNSEEPQSSAGYEPASQPEGNGQGIAIKGMAGVFKAWDLVPSREKEVREIIISRGLKVPDAITEAQRTKGAATVETVEAFLAWLDEAHPASNIIDTEVSE